jgi:hypothetical protein
MDLEPWEECIHRLGGLTPIPGKRFVPLNDDELAAIETEFGAKLPNDYRKFLATYGASTFNCLTSIRSASPLPKSLSDDGLLPFGTFYGTNRDAHAFPSVRFCAEQFAGDIPVGLLPIADGGSDDQICVGLAGEQRGKVFYWDSQGVSDDQGLAYDSNTYYIAHSFTDLLHRIEPFAG